jgi:hypothetical protein
MKRLWLFLSLWLLIGLGWSTAGVAAQANNPTLDEFTQLLREALAASQRNDQIGLEDVSNKLGVVSSVSLPNEATIPVDMAWLKAAASVPNPNFIDISARLSAMLELLTVSRPATADDLAKLASFINDPPFSEEPPEDFTNPAPFVGGSGSFDPQCLVIPAIIFFVVVIGYAIISSRRGLVKNKNLANLADDLKSEMVLPKSSIQAIKQADEVAFEGDYRKAVRYLYLSTLLWLAERQILIFDRTLTNYEVLAAVPPSSPLRARLTPVIHTFDTVWYGFHEIDQQAFDRFRQQVTALREGRNE